MKKVLFTIAIIFGSVSLFAQMPDIKVPAASAPTQNGVTVSGNVYDSVSKSPLEFSSVMLVHEGEKAADGINSDSSGHFIFNNVKPGTYKLTVFYVGYNKLERSVKVEGSDLNLGNVNMNTTSTTLKEVQVIDRKQLIEQRPDGLVYNAEKDFTNKGAMADMVLRKVPMVTVDLQGNVSLRGSGNIRVLIDGKPSTLIAASVKDALQQIPADNIKSVEVITSPGAKYDGEGSAGVINIITKKNVMKGMSGSLFSQLSYNVPREFFTGNAGFNMNYRNKDFGLSLNAGYSRWQMILGMNSTRTDFPGTAQESKLLQNSLMDGGGNFFWSQLSADYQIDSLQSIQAGVGYRPGNWKQDQPMSSAISPMVPNANFYSNTHSENPRDNVGFNASYSKKFKNNPKRTLDILSQYSMNSKTSKYDMFRIPDGSTDTTYRERNNNKSQNNEFTIQADYVQPLKNPKQKIETGLKYINRNINSDYTLQYMDTALTDFVTAPSRTNSLDYTQQVGAAYAQFSSPLGKSLSMIAGVRYEYTDIKGHQNEANSAFNSQFNNLLPNASIAYTLKNFSKLKLAYNMRIERPSIEYINPYINYSDPYNIKQGNPNLVPEKTHNVELTYSTFFNNTNLNFSAFYRHTGNGIENVTSVDTFNVSHTSYANISKNNTLGLDLFGSTTLFKNWMINLNGSLYYMMLKSPSLNIKNDGWQYSTSMYTSYKLSEKFSIAGFAMYSGNQIQLQGKQDGWYYYFLGLQMEILKGKASINLSAENFFTPEIHMNTTYQYQNATYVNETVYYGRGGRLTFNWNFGKMTFSQKKKIKNDDLKDEGSSSPGMGGGGM